MIVTLASLVKAAKKNGHPWANKQDIKNWHITSAGIFSCVVGQAITNLGGSAFPHLTYSDELADLFSKVYYYNDHEAKSYKDAVAFMTETFRGHGRKKVEI